MRTVSCAYEKRYLCYSGQTPAVLGSYLDYTKQTFLSPLSEFWPFSDNASHSREWWDRSDTWGQPQEPEALAHLFSGIGFKALAISRPVGLRSLKITLWCLALILSVHFVKDKTKHIELQTGKSKQWKEMMETLSFLSSGTVSFSEGGMSYSPCPLPPIMLLRSGYKTESLRSPQKKKTKNFWRFIFAWYNLHLYFQPYKSTNIGVFKKSENKTVN